MNVWSKVLAVLIALATLPFFYLAMRTLKTQENWRTRVNSAEQQLTNAIEGQAGSLSLRELEASILRQRVDLSNLMSDRGRVWRTVVAQEMTPDGKVSVQVPAPDPHQLTDQMIVYAFASGLPGEGGVYLGEFKVAAVAAEGGLVQLEPTTKLSEFELNRLSASPGQQGWNLYEVLPADRNDVFDAVEDQVLQRYFPPGDAEQRIRHGNPAAQSDPAELVRDGAYQRALVDYGVMFRELDREIATKSDEIAAGKADAASMQASLEEAQRQIQFRQTHIGELQGELAESTAERDLVSGLREGLDAELARVGGAIQDTLRSVKDLAAKWAEVQTAAAAEIDRIAPPVR